MAGTSSSSSAGIGFFGLLTVALIILKLLGQIQLSWWWIAAILFTPLWIFLLILVIVGIFAGISAVGIWLLDR